MIIPQKSNPLNNHLVNLREIWQMFWNWQGIFGAESVIKDFSVIMPKILKHAGSAKVHLANISLFLNYDCLDIQQINSRLHILTKKINRFSEDIVESIILSGYNCCFWTFFFCTVFGSSPINIVYTCGTFQLQT